MDGDDGEDVTWLKPRFRPPGARSLSESGESSRCLVFGGAQLARDRVGIRRLCTGDSIGDDEGRYSEAVYSELVYSEAVYSEPGGFCLNSDLGIWERV